MNLANELKESLTKNYNPHGRLIEPFKSKVGSMYDELLKLPSSELTYDIMEGTISMAAFYYPIAKALSSNYQVRDLGSSTGIQGLCFNKDQYIGYDADLCFWNCQEAAYHKYFSMLNRKVKTAVFPKDLDKAKTNDYAHTVILSCLCYGYLDYDNNWSLDKLLSKGKYFITDSLINRPLPDDVNKVKISNRMVLYERMN